MNGKMWRQKLNRHPLRALFALMMSFFVLRSAAFTPLSYAWSDHGREENLFETEISEQKEESDLEDAPEDFIDIESLPDFTEADGEPEMTFLKNAEMRGLSPPEEDIVEEETVTETESALEYVEEPVLLRREEDFEREVPLRYSAKSAPVITRSIFRIAVSAEDLEYTAAHHAEYSIADRNGNIVKMLILSDDNLWQTSWEVAADAESSFSVTERGIFDSAGNDITGNWITEPQTSEEADEYDYDGWAVTDSMDSVGNYVIEFDSGGQKYLLAVADPADMKTQSGFHHWKLTGEQNALENATDAAIWNVIKVFDNGIRVKNNALSNDEAYLTTREIGKKDTFAVIKVSSSNLCQFEDHRLKTSDKVYLQAASGEITSVASAEEATVLTLYHPVSYHDMIYEKTVSFCHSSLPPPAQKVNVMVKLLVKGNMGEREREFPLSASVNSGDTILFSLKHGGEYMLSDIPIGARLTVSVVASDHVITSSFSGGEEGETVLTVPGVPAEGGTIVFSAVREAELDAGIRSDTDFCLIFLITLLSYIALHPLIKVKSQKIFNLSTGGKRQ